MKRFLILVISLLSGGVYAQDKEWRMELSNQVYNYTLNGTGTERGYKPSLKLEADSYLMKIRQCETPKQIADTVFSLHKWGTANDTECRLLELYAAVAVLCDYNPKIYKNLKKSLDKFMYLLGTKYAFGGPGLSKIKQYNSLKDQLYQLILYSKYN